MGNLLCSVGPGTLSLIDLLRPPWRSRQSSAFPLSCDVQEARLSRSSLRRYFLHLRTLKCMHFSIQGDDSYIALNMAEGTSSYLNGI